MRQSELFSKTLKEAPKEEVSINAKFLERGGFIYKNSAGVYTLLPLGWLVIKKIEGIIREEMDEIGGQELLMPALHDKKYLKTTGRWDVDVVFKIAEADGKEPQFNISWTHEEIMSEIASCYVSSYRDLPFSSYQIQTKFRNEPRAKSGLLRGREFIMKDLYSFHRDEKDLDRFYEIVKNAYTRIFEKCGLKTVYTLAAGGDFTTNYTHEFQVITPVGEDTIYVCEKCGYAENKEISQLQDEENCKKCGGNIKKEKAIEVGNIFRYGTKYSEPFNLKFTDEDGHKKFVFTGAYGIGISRLMGTIVEVFHDEAGIIWPEEVAPFKYHLICVGNVSKEADSIYQDLQEAGIKVLYDDREKSAGEKFADSDLIGIPNRIVVSAKTLGEKSVELKERKSGKIALVKLDEIKKI